MVCEEKCFFLCVWGHLPFDLQTEAPLTHARIFFQTLRNLSLPHFIFLSHSRTFYPFFLFICLFYFNIHCSHKFISPVCVWFLGTNFFPTEMLFILLFKSLKVFDLSFSLCLPFPQSNALQTFFSKWYAPFLYYKIAMLLSWQIFVAYPFY